MRRRICLGIVAAAVLVVPMAQSATAPPSVTLNASKFQVRYGDRLHLAGTVSTHKAGVMVEIYSRAFTASGPTQLASVRTGEGGAWSYDAKPGIATSYQARTGASTSRTLLVGVRPAISITQLDNGRLQVEVVAGRSFAGRAVKVQKLDAGLWTTLAQLHLNGKSTALVPSSLVPPQSSTLRATMSVNQAGQGYLGGFSTPLALPSRWVSLTLSMPEISFGDQVTLTGRVSTRQAGMPLTVLARPAADAEFQPLASLKTGTGGRWTLTTTPKVGTVYQAQFSDATSRILGVGVHPGLTAMPMSRAQVMAHVDAGRSLKGRDVQVQQLVEGQWKTLAKLPLNRDNEATFTAAQLPGGSSTLRLAMSVNQAGTGYLGAFSEPFVYQR
jgi:hypothetical protein